MMINISSDGMSEYKVLELAKQIFKCIVSQAEEADLVIGGLMLQFKLVVRVCYQGWWSLV